MPDFFKKRHLNHKNAFVLFQTKRTNSYIIYCPRFELPVSRYPFFSKRDRSMSVLAIGIRAFKKKKHRICLQALQNSFPSLTMKSSSGNCRIRSCNGTFEFTVSLLPRRLYLPEVDCTDRSLAIDEVDTILAEEEKDFPAYHLYFFLRWC